MSSGPSKPSKSIYASPFRVYLVLGALALAGIFSGFRLPISLFPNSTKPEVTVKIPFGNLTPEEFLNSYGRDIEGLLRQVAVGKTEVDDLTASYQRREVEYILMFKWGGDPRTAENEVTNRVNSYAARLPEESRDGLQIWLHNEDSGFFAASFYSPTRSLDSLHELLEPILIPRANLIRDASQPVLYNPTSKEVRVELNPEVMASLRLVPSDIDRALSLVLKSFSGGSVTNNTRTYFVEMPRLPLQVEDLGRIPIKTGTGKWVHLNDVADIDFGPRTVDNRSFKTNGASSLILFATPRPGGNVKRMSEELIRVIEEVKPTLPKDIQFKILVDPSEFIRSAIDNVLHEVGLAALLAVVVLFLFIGSVRNVATAAIEIPLSMILAFILMRLTGINLNLISLGGLALSAGMNVDASVVVMENIFRKFEERDGRVGWLERIQLITEAVNEVKFAVIASTVASLVVFLPLVFTSGLSYAILGDLAMAVVFSHGFSAAVALVLVPTIRLQLMGKEQKHAKPPIEKQISQLENGYASLLNRFILHPRAKWFAVAAVPLALTAVILFVLPRLPKEVVAVPDTDWIWLNVKTQGNTLQRQMEVYAEEVEGSVLKEFGDKIQYTFTQVNGLNNASIMSRLKTKSDMQVVWDAMEKKFTNTPFIKFRMGPWNPSELPIPDPPHLRVSLHSPDPAVRAEFTRELSDLLQEKNLYPRVWSFPNVDADATVQLLPHIDQWEDLSRIDARILPSELADIARVATVGRRAGLFPHRNTIVPVMLRYPKDYVEAPEDIGALPIGIGDKVVPLRALATVKVTRGVPTIYRSNDQEMNVVEAKLNRSEARESETVAADAKRVVNDWKLKRGEALAAGNVTIAFEDPNKDLTEAIYQLKIAVGLSILLIFFVLMFQFGTVFESLLVLVAIPLGILGVMLSLYVFRSTLSLNSILGVILLNGISVANSILLVDFTKRLHAEGLSAREAAVQAARLRLRPILITSLTTILGMLPIAIGMGEGGRILQPLGIAVSGGLWVSMMLTLFLVPALHAWALEHQNFMEFGKDLLLRLRALSWKSAATTSVLLWGLSSSAYAAPEAPASEPLEFTAALKAIVDRSTSVGTSVAALDAQRSNNLPARLAFLPSISFSGYRRESRDYGALNKSLNSGVELSSTVNLVKWGADYNGVRVANFKEDALDFGVGVAILKAEDDGVRGIVGIIQVTQEIKIYESISDTLLRSLEIARERYHQGLLPSQEVDKVMIDYENSTASLRDAEIRLRTAKATMVALLGHDNLNLDWPWRSKLTEKAPDFGNANDLLPKRPDWLAAEATVKSNDAQVDQALGKVMPSLDLTVAYGYLKQHTVKAEGDYWSANVSLSVPLFDRLSNFSSYRAQIHNKASAEWALEQVKRTAKQEWEASRTALDIALETAKTRDNTLLTARNLYRDNLRRFHRGATSANDLIVDQNRVANAELFAIRGWAQVHINFMQACHALGKTLNQCPL